MMTNLAGVLKLFLPSWNFFDDFAATTGMEFRLRRPAARPVSEHDASVGTGSWRRLFPDGPTRGLVRVVWNSRGNAVLFEQACVERAADRLAQLPASGREAWGKGPDGVALSDLVRRRAQGPVTGWPGSPTVEVQYRLRPTPTVGGPEEWFTSPWFPLEQTERPG